MEILGPSMSKVYCLRKSARKTDDNTVTVLVNDSDSDLAADETVDSKYSSPSNSSVGEKKSSCPATSSKRVCKFPRQTEWKENTVAVNRPAFSKLQGVI
jgi:hypothetical protein